eukprot:2851238-Prymnesium_polylepis.2
MAMYVFSTGRSSSATRPQSAKEVPSTWPTKARSSTRSPRRRGGGSTFARAAPCRLFRDPRTSTFPTPVALALRGARHPPTRRAQAAGGCALRADCAPQQPSNPEVALLGTSARAAHPLKCRATPALTPT